MAADLNEAPYVLLDDSRPAAKGGRSLLFHSPERIIVARTLAEVPSALAAIDRAAAEGLHVAGWISYECAAHFEPRLAAAIRHFADEPLIWMLATRHRAELAPADVAALLGADAPAGLSFGPSVESRESYLEAIQRVHDYIDAGDVYQINHTFPLPCWLSGSLTALYARLRQYQPVPYGALIDTGETRVLSLSPELFVRHDGKHLTGQPMKGTAPRGRTTAEDAAIVAALKADAKSQAENLMIVDLIRNDLSRLATPGSVEVRDLFATEQYATLHQMTSTIRAGAPDGLTPSRLLKALFPCGSVTGAPKVRAMEIIAALEKAPRGIYCGAIGHFSPAASGADWALNVPIRTLVLNAEGEGRLSVGSGVVADSRGEGEYDECLLKARFALMAAPAFDLIETLLHDPATGFARLDRHLARLADSARYFDFACDPTALRQALDAEVAGTESRRRVRLALARDGTVKVTSAPLPAAVADRPLTVCLAAERLRSDDRFLFHKTTNRDVYDAAFARAQGAGHADILFFNERGELCEGAISSLFLVKDGGWFTPAADCGLLPGVLRAEMLEDPARNIAERRLTLADLMAADTLYIGNSVRGLRPVRLDPSEL